MILFEIMIMVFTVPIFRLYCFNLIFTPVAPRNDLDNDESQFCASGTISSTNGSIHVSIIIEQRSSASSWLRVFGRFYSETFFFWNFNFLAIFYSLVNITRDPSWSLIFFLKCSKIFICVSLIRWPYDIDFFIQTDISVV